MPTAKPAHLHTMLSSTLSSRLPTYLLAAFATITTLAVFLPLSPTMPADGLDPSWMFAMNEAVARHLKIGRDVIFTFGPYASVYSRAYHPGTDHLMVFGSLLLGTSYLIALLYLAGTQKPYVLLVLMLFLSSFVSTLHFTRDSLLLSYPLLLVACVSRYAHLARRDGRMAPPLWRASPLALGFASLGLLPLVKGSLLLPSAAVACISSVFLWHRFRSKLALVPLLVPIAAGATFWSLSGQSLSDLPPFLANTMLLTSGYTEAMGAPTTWPAVFDYGLVLSYVLVASLLCYSLVRSPALDKASKWSLGVSLAVFLFLAFKAGFVRCDQWHIVTSFGGVAIGALIVCFMYVDRYVVGAVVLASMVAGVVLVRYDPILSEEVVKRFGAGTASAGRRQAEIVAFVAARALGTFSRNAYERTRNTYVDAWDGLRSRVADGTAMQRRYAAALADIRTAYGVPELAGTTDLYSYDQAILLASHNLWRPRPIFQSFAAYSPDLARLNEQHLRNAFAPDNVLLRVQTIDGRIPALDDGSSWLALLDNYTVVSRDSRFAHMRRKHIVLASSDLEVIHEGTHAIGATVALPKADGPTYAIVDLQPTLLGRLVTTVFRPPQLRLTFRLRDGRRATYRVIAGMASSGFIVSPLIRSTEDFVYLASGDPGFHESGRVESISISPSFGGSLLWSGTYALKVAAYHRNVSSAGPWDDVGGPAAGGTTDERGR